MSGRLYFWERKKKWPWFDHLSYWFKNLKSKRVIELLLFFRWIQFDDKGKAISSAIINGNGREYQFIGGIVSVKRVEFAHLEFLFSFCRGGGGFTQRKKPIFLNIAKIWVQNSHKSVPIHEGHGPTPCNLFEQRYFPLPVHHQSIPNRHKKTVRASTSMFHNKFIYLFILHVHNNSLTINPGFQGRRVNFSRNFSKSKKDSETTPFFPSPFLHHI